MVDTDQETTYDTTPTPADELVPVHCQAYEDDAELDIDYEGMPTIENHDELVAEDMVYDEIRAMHRRSTERHGISEVEPGDALWDDRFGDLEPGDSWRLDELE